MGFYVAYPYGARFAAASFYTEGYGSEFSVVPFDIYGIIKFHEPHHRTKSLE